MNPIGKKVVLVAPLDWGLGHATRCIPVIRYFLDRECEVLLGTAGPMRELLRQEFPALEQIPFPSYGITYPKHPWAMPFSMMTQMGKVLRAARQEHLLVESVCAQRGVDLVVSDNRFGCWSHSVPSVYMTHQLRIAAPALLRGLEPVGERLHQYVVRHFHSVWIPDWDKVPGLSGKLGRPARQSERYRFIGPLSRFQATRTAGTSLDLLVLVSGPEPQRSLFGQEVLRWLWQSALGWRVTILFGCPGSNDVPSVPPGCTAYSHLPTEQLAQLLASSQLVLARPGYSTVMDLCRFGSKALLVPTPGQTEQEYLALHLQSQGWAMWIAQGQLSDAALLEAVRSPMAFPLQEEPPLEKVLAGYL